MENSSASRKKRRCGIALVLLAIPGIAAGLTWALSPGLPSLEGRSLSTALTDTGATRLGNAVSPLAEAHRGMSGILALRDSRETFAARVRLARAAERSLDVQYYIWRNDLTGTLLLEELHEAADRGVRVRLLLDDNNTLGLDDTLAALDAHPGIEVRLFNPFVIRSPRWLGYLSDFSRLNRRMHNKSFTADNQATIIGGRNVGDEYFDVSGEMVFSDLDVMAVGPVISEVSRDFDRYWASKSSYPVARLLAPAAPRAVKRLDTAASLIERDRAAASYMSAVQELPLVRDMMEGRLALTWAKTQMISDDPAKGLGLAARDSLLFARLTAIIGQPVARLDLVSAYFVPGEEGTRVLASMARRGVRVRVLTNSLAATDVAAVHAGYSKRRRALLEAGVELFEMVGSAVPREKHAFGGSQSSSLHAKTFAVDGARIFVGSFNFDPRSAELNTEMGFVMQSAPLAQKLSAAFDESIASGRSYEVRLSDAGKMYWLERRGMEVVRHDMEPRTTFWQRTGVALVSWLPIEWLL
jgi:putative cardiolipin synthase